MSHDSPQLFDFLFPVCAIVVIAIFGLKMIAGSVTGDWRIFPKDNDDEDDKQ